MLLRPGHVILRRGPHENRTRPAIDPLFRSAAVTYRSRVIGVVLSGLLDDGCAGLIAIKACGGLCVVQDPDDAIWPEMPRNALAHDNVDHCVPAAELPGLLTRLVREPPGPTPPIPDNLFLEAGIAAQETSSMVREPVQLGRPSHLSCPQCGGVLNEVLDEGSTRFRCQIGHAFSAETLSAAQNEELERAMESALRMHRERVVLFRRMQEKSEVPGDAACGGTLARRSGRVSACRQGNRRGHRQSAQAPDLTFADFVRTDVTTWVGCSLTSHLCGCNLQISVGPKSRATELTAEGHRAPAGGRTHGSDDGAVPDLSVQFRGARTGDQGR